MVVGRRARTDRAGGGRVTVPHLRQDAQPLAHEGAALGEGRHGFAVAEGVPPHVGVKLLEGGARGPVGKAAVLLRDGRQPPHRPLRPALEGNLVVREGGRPRRSPRRRGVADGHFVLRGEHPVALRAPLHRRLPQRRELRLKGRLQLAGAIRERSPRVLDQRDDVEGHVPVRIDCARGEGNSV